MMQIDSTRTEDLDWSDEFKALAGSWEDDRTADEIIRDIEGNRMSAERDEIA